MKEGVTILPLYHFFQRLRVNGFMLGIGEYEAFLKGLRYRMNLQVDDYSVLLQTLHDRSSLVGENSVFPKAELLQICKLLWLKPNQSVQVFEEIFEETYSLDYGHLVKAANEKTSEKKDPPLTKPSPDKVTPDLSTLNGEAQGEYPNESTGSLTTEGAADTEPLSVRIAVSERGSNKELELLQEKKLEIEQSKFLFTSYYYPIDRRKIQQNMKSLPSFMPAGYGVEIDIAATVNRTISNGFFDVPIFKKKKVNTTYLLLLIDHHGSMVAFEQLASEIQAQLQGALGCDERKNAQSFQTVYFYNCITDQVYLNKLHTKSERIEKILDGLKAVSANVIFISDAGAARGRVHSRKIQLTKELLEKMRVHTQRIAWLNPLPEHRWKGTSAEAIAQQVAMFELRDQGIKHAVDFLKGKTTKLIQLK